MAITITTPLYYVNDKPHLGSTYTTIACDVFARFKRLQGEKVIFITGVDEHGQKIERKARDSNIEPIDHCNNISAQYQSLWHQWQITNDKFIRTTSAKHLQLVHKFYSRVFEKGDIYLGKQKGWYCVGCEEFKELSTLNPSKTCLIHQKPLEWRNEENLFFKLTNYQKQIETLVEGDFILPKSRKNEVIKFVSQGLKDFSISRLNLDWGIPVPGYDGHTFYVWFDALLGYISALFNDSNKIDLNQLSSVGWPAYIHIIGKDILRFHAVYWPAMLISAGIELPKRVYGHGFLTREGQKMGKSLGNVLDPELLMAQYGSDSIRWFLLSDIKFGQDGDFQNKRFIDLLNNDLANTVGNLINRTSSMSRKWFDNSTPIINKNDTLNNKLSISSLKTINSVISNYENLEFKEAASEILKLASDANLYLNDNQPWKFIKQEESKSKVAIDIYVVLDTSRIIGLLLMPIIPNVASKLLNQLGYKYTPDEWKEELNIGLLNCGMILPDPVPIYNRIESLDM
tara:strand:- start:356 stop:1894 length:1539 start_codon:yes stop_codon:yes gene_type:complete